MSFQAFNSAFSQRTVVIDPATGLLTKDGRALILALFNRTGAGTGIVPVVKTGLIAAGSTQTTALGLTADWNEVDTVAVGTGVQMPNMNPGNDIWIWNNGANPLSVYPFGGAAIHGNAVNAPVTLAAGALAYYQVWKTNLLLTVLINATP